MSLLENYFPYLPIFAAFLLTIIFLFWRRKNRFKTLAKSLGLSLTTDSARFSLERMNDLPLFLRGERSHASNVMRGSLSGAEVVIFEYNYIPEPEYNNKNENSIPVHYKINYVTQTVIGFHSPNISIPFFSIQPKEMEQEQIEVVRYKTVEIKNNPTFSNNYFLFGKDEDAVLELFTSKLIQFFCNNLNQLSSEGEQNTVIFYQRGRKLTPQEISEFLDLAKEAYHLFCRL